MRQSAPIRGESMETLIVQNITVSRPLDLDAPLLPDRRESQHVTVDQPGAIRHISDINRYLINRNIPIGGHLKDSKKASLQEEICVNIANVEGASPTDDGKPNSHAVRFDESSGAHVSANEADWAARPDDEGLLISQALDKKLYILLPALERQNQIANSLLGSLHDVIDNRYRAISEALLSRDFIRHSAEQGDKLSDRNGNEQ
ncbi:462aa6ab-e349-4144-9afc-566cee688438 [Sclerotinia trifoliorum]|uniref:462aa6ab-e349-4144-9afc-566cee688438 n=1 Tax=Sclerotinia trifoliorum TaxID=28548 RepID=A0A8H2W1U9_9HELO|nr:462aa6ab-e349-4144-9afc-566cee688438 [Sclerotinia trifoliorum]